MFAQVNLLNGFFKPLTYAIPKHLQKRVTVGSIVTVPLRAAKVPALVTLITEKLDPSITFDIKDILGLENFPQDAHYFPFITKASQFYFCQPIHFYQKLKKFLDDKKREDIKTPATINRKLSGTEITLTNEQALVVNYVSPFLKKPLFAPTLLHGVTGSGKTEVYKALIQQAHLENKSVLMLLPEVSLSMQFELLFKKSLNTIDVFGFHSASTIVEKRALWQSLIAGKPVLIIGVHLPILLPIANLGLIIIDEEHELGFIEKKHPKINSKDLALWRASIYNLPILLGSATPSLTSLANTQTKNWKLMHITKRFAGAFPTVQKVILSDLPKLKKRASFWVTPVLEKAIRNCIERKEQAIIYINRRGYSFFVQCKSCGFIFQCPHCSVSLTLHYEHEDANSLRCHYCNFSKKLPAQCPDCKQPASQFIKKGIGTQQAVQLFQEIFPSARIARADMDTTSKKRSWQETVVQFERGEIDILIGTQTITKGYHFPNVTLIGILWADLNLHFPVYNAAETTLQQLIQVAGRAGRTRPGSHVIVQALRDHTIFDYANEESYIDFCKKELLNRQEIAYPPCGRLATIELRHQDALQVTNDAECCANFFRKTALDLGNQVSVLGPAMPLISKIQNIEIRTILLKSQTFTPIHTLIRAILDKKYASDIFVTVG